MRSRTAAVMVAALAAAGGVVGVAQPAWAAAAGHGYVWGYQPATPVYVAASGYELNSAGGPITIVRSGVGDYRVTFGGLALAGGIAHVSAYGPGNSDFCTVSAWGSSGADEVIRVRCFDGLGAASDSMFVANVTNLKAPSLAYAYANVAVPAGWYAPSNQYDSTGAVIQIGRIGVGRYLVDAGTLMADAPAAYYGGYLRATAQGNAPVRCEVLDPVFWAPPYIPVSCYDIAGVWVDSRFTLTYARQSNLLGKAPDYGNAIALPSPIAPPSILAWTSPGAAPTAAEIGVGSYLVTFPGLAHVRGHAIANAFGTPPSYCTVAGWWPSGTAEVVWVQCYDASLHAPTPVFAFNVTFTP